VSGREKRERETGERNGREKRERKTEYTVVQVDNVGARELIINASDVEV
jgi:hypothetical protein